MNNFVFYLSQCPNTYFTLLVPDLKIFIFRYILYDVNAPEGFNLRRDVFMRMAIFVRSLADSGDWHLVRKLIPFFIYLLYYVCSMGIKHLKILSN